MPGEITAATRESERVTCQVCRRPLVALNDGTSRNHVPRRGGHFEDYCRGSGHRLARWPVGQWLVHHGGSVWEVVEDAGGRWDDYVIRCVVGSRSFDGDRWLEAPGKTMRVHGEYVHRDGWRATREFRVRWARLSNERRARVMLKAQWEHVPLSGVLRDWPALFDPEREQDDDELAACRDLMRERPDLFSETTR